MPVVITFNEASAVMRNFASCFPNIYLQGDQYGTLCDCKKVKKCFGSEGMRYPKANYGLESGLLKI